ncbi:heme biosynthesis protein [Myxococcus stipitatus DSM 14675]|uniref:Heme biosynthesis protein n=1 Tax=Myxococcus stipitatus (strain DSM 14675 / JCM 12634 / Mx s8) TaxID=1278073 RepID=L7U5H9_MYXSD|nr:radical SAM protein [Myxococcus stipitatus]AGC43368.1 heme biosynthesis protein [Myxococcus stipitatus DSM 14675]
MSVRIRERHESWGTIVYDNLRDEFSAKVYEGCEPVPQSPIGCGWLVTAPCNLKCIHCYGNDEDLPSERLSTPQQLKVADEIIRAGIMRQILSGGEPLMRKDTLQVIEKLTDNGVATILGTNGTFLTAQMMKTVSKCTRVEISLDSMDERVNNEIRPSRNIKGNTYKETLRAIGLCVDSGVAPRILTCLNRHNSQHVEELAQFIYERGIRDWAISWTLNAGRAYHIYSELMPEETNHVTAVVEKLRLRYPDMQIRLSDRTVNYSRYYFLIWPNGIVGTEEIVTGKKLFFSSLVTGTVKDGWTRENYDWGAHFRKWVGDRVQVIPQETRTALSA